MRGELPPSVTQEVRDRCICLHLQRAARAMGRRFDTALRPLGLTSGQYCLLVSLSRPHPPRICDMAEQLVISRRALAAALKPLKRRRLLTVVPDPDDKRSRRLVLTDAGVALLAEAVPLWRAAHDALGKQLLGGNADALRGDLLALAFWEDWSPTASRSAARASGSSPPSV